LREQCQAIVVLVRRVSGGNKKHPVQSELAYRRAGRLHVRGMYGIEGSAEKSDIQRFENPKSRDL
jgi:hypothetical protein